MNIVLAHGILGFRTLFNINYFNGIKAHLEQKHQAKVLVTEVDPTAGIAERGKQLRQQILHAFEAGEGEGALNPDDETHIIAHSMGGLDSRFILSPSNPDNIADHITSLTTIGTPHLGSPLADALYPLLDGQASLNIVQLGEEWALEFLSKLGVSADGLRDLTTENGVLFNQQTPDAPDVSYFWTAGIGRSALLAKASNLLLPSYEYLKWVKNEDNDGAVPLSSASHGEQIGQLWEADHLDEVGHDLDYLPNGFPLNFNHFAKYDEIIKKVASL